LPSGVDDLVAEYAMLVVVLLEGTLFEYGHSRFSRCGNYTAKRSVVKMVRWKKEVLWILGLV